MIRHEAADDAQIHGAHGSGAEASTWAEPVRATRTPDAEPASYRERVGLSRRALFATGAAMTTVAASANQAAAQFSDLNHGANDPLPVDAVQTDALLFPGFRQSFIKTEGVDVNGRMASAATINVLVGGKGPPLLLIHGHPETHVAWHKVAAKLAETYTVVLTDLRGYGDSSKPDGGTDHIDYSKRAMGADQVQVMKALGFERFQAVGHDRGGRVLHFMMMDYPKAVVRGAVLDIAPTDLMYEKTNKEFATKYFWWFFQIQNAPVPERFIGAMPGFYLSDHLDVQNKTPGAVTPVAFAAYLRCYSEPAAIHAVCEDYRAAAGIDSEMLEADRKAGRKVAVPIMAIWGEKGTVGQMFDLVGMWKQEADNVSGQGLPCGHLIPEEDPDGLLKALGSFLRAT